MIGIRCKVCGELVGSVDGNTMMCEMCWLEAENANLKTLLRRQQILTVEAVDIGKELKASWEELKTWFNPAIPYEHAILEKMSELEQKQAVK
jgi:hypothetical protein